MSDVPADALERIEELRRRMDWSDIRPRVFDCGAALYKWR